MLKHNIVRVSIYKGRAILRESSSFDLKKTEEKAYIIDLYVYFKKLASNYGWEVKLSYVMDQTVSEITQWVEMLRENGFPDYKLDTFDPEKVY